MTDLRAANNLHGSVIHPGDTLVIPNMGGAAGTAVAAVAAPREDIAAQLPERQATSGGKSSGSRVHVVKPGDTLWGVARRYSVTVPSLAAANGLGTQSHLAAGTRLEIPGASGGGSSGENTRMTYQVRRGDTLSEIAEKFNVSVAQLMTWNRLRQSSSLRTGQRLVVYADPQRVNGG
jgi:membrane-bound lytic murein transglycosylase D